MTERDPRMLPGIPAIVLGFIAACGFVLFAGVAIIAIPTGWILEIVADHSHAAAAIYGTTLITGCGLGAIITAVFLPLSRVKQRRELEAGYTTSLTEFNQLDGISWRTGEVVRPAVIGSVASANSGQITSGAELDPVDLGHSWLRTALGRRWFAPLMALSVVALVGGVVWPLEIVLADDGNAPDSQTGLVVALFCVAMAGLCGVIITPVEYAVFFLPRYYRTRMAAHFAEAKVFLAVPNDADAIDELLGVDGGELPHARRRLNGYLVVESDTLVLYSRYKRTALPYLSIPRSRITAATIGSTSSYWGSNNMPYPDVVLTVQKENGTPYKLELVLAITKGSIRSPQIHDDCNWVVNWASASPQPK